MSESKIAGMFPSGSDLASNGFAESFSFSDNYGFSGNTLCNTDGTKQEREAIQRGSVNTALQYLSAHV